MPIRLPIAIGLGILTAFALFWVMQALIGVSGELKEGRPDPRVEFVRLKRDSTPQTKEREPPKREKPDQPPPPPQMNLSQNINPGEAVGDITPIADTGAELAEAASMGSGAGSDRGAVPLVRVDPDYPPRAKQRGIEGYVTVEFTISPVGTVQDPKVIDASPRGVFEESALRAVRRWRYNPMIENGVAVARISRTRLIFKLPRG